MIHPYFIKIKFKYFPIIFLLLEVAVEVVTAEVEVVVVGVLEEVKAQVDEEADQVLVKVQVEKEVLEVEKRLSLNHITDLKVCSLQEEKKMLLLQRI